MKYIWTALLSAVLFGSSTPIGKVLLDSLPPFQLAGLLYVGAALGVLPFSLRRREIRVRNPNRRTLALLSGAILTGGILGPVLLLFGLKAAPAVSVAMWLNLELVFTAVLGFFLFKDHLGPLGWVGVGGTLAASVLLSWTQGAIGWMALGLVGGAGLCWALDNHLTALIDGITPSQSTLWKGLAAGTTNLAVSTLFEPVSLDPLPLLTAIGVGVFAYGFSISLYILSAHHLGATRSQMIFSSAPFFGVALSAVFLGEGISLPQMSAAAILAASLFTLFRDQHGHFHTHEVLFHTHDHRHSEPHHQHDHDEETDETTHSHWHRHTPVAHSHPHWPDIHHRHTHEED